MKTNYLILLALIAIALTACDISGSTNNTPDIRFVTTPFVNKSDTLNTYATDESGVYRLDSINVGDTVIFRILLYGYSNNLSSYNVIQSDTSATKLILPHSTSLDSIFISAASNYPIGKFIFKSKITSLYFPFKFVAKKVSKDAKLTFYLSSDASFKNSNFVGNSSVTIILKTPIKLPKVKPTV